MIIVGELINASRKKVAPAIEAKDVDAIQKIAKDEQENGADYVDVNAGIFVGEESDYLKWLVTTVQEAVGVAGVGGEVKVAGLCEGSQGRVTINQSLALLGGFTKTDWLSVTSATILDAQGLGRVVTITGARSGSGK